MTTPSQPPYPLVAQSETVLLAPGPVCSISRTHTDYLCELARTVSRRRARINLHATNADKLHEMIVAVAGDSYIRPHRHPGKSESFHMIEGEVDVVVFDDSGDITDCVRLSAPGGAGAFCYRMSEPLFHTVVVKSAMAVFHEVTDGPFILGQAVTAPFAPDEGDADAGAAFLRRLRERIQ